MCVWNRLNDDSSWSELGDATVRLGMSDIKDGLSWVRRWFKLVYQNGRSWTYRIDIGHLEIKIQTQTTCVRERKTAAIQIPVCPGPQYHPASQSWQDIIIKDVEPSRQKRNTGRLQESE